MPQVTVYIREDDLDTWKRISKKSEFIHNSLKTAGAYMDMSEQERAVVKNHVAELAKDAPLIRPLSEVIEERKYAKAKTIAGIRVEPLVKPPKPSPPPELQHEPMPGAPHRYYHTEWEEYVKWTPEEGITQP